MTTFLPAPELLDSPLGRPFPAVLAGSPATAMTPDRVRVAVVGAGPAGLALASHLWHALGDLSEVALLDPHPRPAARFLDRIAALRQRVLRSPYEHHLGAHNSRDCELLDFARSHWRLLTGTERNEVRMAMSGQRSVVPRDVFEAYTRHVVSCHGVAARCWPATVERVEPEGGRWRVRHRAGSLLADAVVLAVGERSRPVPEQWRADDRVQPWDVPLGAGRRVAVVGSGLSAAHVLATVCAAGGQAVWIQRGTERYQCADVNARFFRPEGRSGFAGLPAERRLALLRRHRRPSMMYEFRPLLRHWEAEGCLLVYRQRTLVEVRAGRSLSLLLDGGTWVRGVDRLVAALGTEPAGLPVAPREQPLVGGFPVPRDDTLELPGPPGLFVTGVHASLALGPAARNIDGMRVAAARIARGLGLGG